MLTFLNFLVTLKLISAITISTQLTEENTFAPFNQFFLTGKERVIHNGLEIKCDVITKGPATIVQVNDLIIRLLDRKEYYVNNPEKNADNIGLTFEVNGKTFNVIVSIFITKILFNEFDQIKKFEGLINFNSYIEGGTSTDYENFFVDTSNCGINIFCNNMIKKDCEIKFVSSVTCISKHMPQNICANKSLNQTIANLPENKIDDNELIYFMIHNGTIRYVTQKSIL